MKVVIRKMKSEESKTVTQLGKKQFSGLERVFLPKAKDAFVAVVGKEIVGAVLYKYYTANGKKIGYIDYIFVDSEYHGKGIGKKLCKDCFKLMWNEGCDALSAIVKDDNVGSWTMFLQNGFKRMKVEDIIKTHGFMGMLHHYFKTPLAVAVGMELYIKVKESDELIVDKWSDKRELANFIIVNMLIGSLALINRAELGINLLIAVFIVLSGRVVAGYIGTKNSKEDWSFRYIQGGLIPAVLVSLQSVFILLGNWYPKKYRKDKEFEKALGKTAFAQWLWLLIIVLLSYTSLMSYKVISIMSSISMTLLVYTIIPYYPFDSFGSARILKWNKWIYFICMVITVSILADKWN